MRYMVFKTKAKASLASRRIAHNMNSVLTPDEQIELWDVPKPHVDGYYIIRPENEKDERFKGKRLTSGTPKHKTVDRIANKEGRRELPTSHNHNKSEH